MSLEFLFVRSSCSGRVDRYLFVTTRETLLWPDLEPDHDDEYDHVLNEII